MRARLGRRTAAALVAALALAGGAAAFVVVHAGERGSSGDRFAGAERAREAVLVPRRKRPPQVVEPQAGDVGGDAGATVPTGAPPSPAGPESEAPDSGARSDAAVARELAELRRASRQYALADLDFSEQLLSPGSLPPGGWRRSVASVYTLYGGPLACGGRLRPEQLGVAHKTAPCGTLVTFRYRGRALRVPVIDRGPYIAGREWDFTGATATALRFPGLGTVEWRL